MTDVLATAELLSRGPDDGDWNEVRRQASRGRRRRQASVMFALVGAVAVVIASAYAFGHPIIDFGSAPKGPEKVVNDFGSLEVGAPAGMAPGVLPEEARRITAVPIDGKEHVLWVAPTKQGGFCESWSQFIGGCPRRPSRQVREAHRRRRNPRRSCGLVLPGDRLEARAQVRRCHYRRDPVRVGDRAD